MKTGGGANPFFDQETIDRMDKHEDHMAKKQERLERELAQKNGRPADWKPYKRPHEIDQTEVDREVAHKTQPYAPGWGKLKHLDKKDLK